MSNNLKKLQDWLEGKRLSGFWVTKPENVYWLTEFRGSFGIVLVQKKGRNLLITDSRYKSIAEKLCKEKNFDFFLYDKDFTAQVKKEFAGSAYGIEDSLTVARLQGLQKAFPRINWKPQSGVLEKLRKEKTEDEIQKIKTAQAHVDEIFKTFFHQNLKAGVTEKEVAYKLRQAIEDGGKYDHAFDLIVAFGANSAVPHHQNSDAKLKKNQNILVDCGAKFAGYCSDMTRNFWFGDTVDPEYQEKYNLLLWAQEASLDEIEPGAKTKAVDAVCRKILGTETKYFTHSLGHGVGLEIHEMPNLSPRSKDTLGVDEVVTTEPGLYYEGKFGIRIEDLVVVREDGAEILSKTSKELITISK